MLSYQSRMHGYITIPVLKAFLRYKRVFDLLIVFSFMHQLFSFELNCCWRLVCEFQNDIFVGVGKWIKGILYWDDTNFKFSRRSSFFITDCLIFPQSVSRKND